MCTYDVLEATMTRPIPLYDGIPVENEVELEVETVEELLTVMLETVEELSSIFEGIVVVLVTKEEADDEKVVV